MRVFGLPVPVDAHKAQASYENGMLTLALSKAASVQPRRIHVRHRSKSQERSSEQSQAQAQAQEQPAEGAARTESDPAGGGSAPKDVPCTVAMSASPGPASRYARLCVGHIIAEPAPVVLLPSPPNVR